MAKEASSRVDYIIIIKLVNLLKERDPLYLSEFGSLLSPARISSIEYFKVLLSR